MRRMTVIEITGMVLKTVTIGLKNIENCFLNPATIPNKKPKKEANNNPTNKRNIVWNITDNESILINIFPREK